MKNTQTPLTPLGKAARQKTRGEVVSPPYEWKRVTIALTRQHLEFISRKAHELGWLTPTYVVKQIIEDAMTRDLVDR